MRALIIVTGVQRACTYGLGAFTFTFTNCQFPDFSRNLGTNWALVASKRLFARCWLSHCVGKHTVRTGDWIFVKMEDGGRPNSVVSRNFVGMKSHLQEYSDTVRVLLLEQKLLKAVKRFVMITSPAPRYTH
jgi:hypothetical protein